MKEAYHIPEGELNLRKIKIRQTFTKKNIIIFIYDLVKDRRIHT